MRWSDGVTYLISIPSKKSRHLNASFHIKKKNDFTSKASMSRMWTSSQMLVMHYFDHTCSPIVFESFTLTFQPYKSKTEFGIGIGIRKIIVWYANWMNMNGMKTVLFWSLHLFHTVSISYYHNYTYKVKS